MTSIDAYAAEIRRLAQKYEGQIKILLGFEADYFCSARYGNAVPDKQAYGRFAPDFLIGSVHFINASDEEFGFYTVDNKAECVGEALERFYKKPDGTIDGRTAVCDYFEAERQMLKKGKFEIIGHPDLIKLRNGALNFFDENENWYKEQLQLTAKAIAAAGVIAEINTGAIARGLMNDVYPGEQFLGYLKEQGVPVCINADAHKCEFLDASFDHAAECAKKAGYDELSYPVEGKMVHIKL
jgi:histidinol-phosphatase (PHP family)